MVRDMIDAIEATIMRSMRCYSSARYPYGIVRDILRDRVCAFLAFFFFFGMKFDGFLDKLFAALTASGVDIVCRLGEFLAEFLFFFGGDRF